VLVDKWVCTPFESGPAALDHLVAQIAAAFVCRDARVEITAQPIPLRDVPDPS
jgi:hypothetical protein